ncbi:TonB-dependent receptor [Pseudochryseolinea flava]|uniref:TonB-dependent receptor n=1 Tax=Pseudochryseolinea flava TaxID=2059302 RepID=A0A364Y1K8_9BACT|nr:carboxypeptidase-like regulatory domain-containing protein [Pseudochryseolinea flava]RAW00594.1 TonB-dependent receptor [Pseudochryseolinea flava]
MKLKLFVLAIGCVLFSAAYAQKIQQTVRGTIVDQDSQVPIVGASVMVINSNPLIGALTDENGNFRLSNVPIGRVTLKVSFIGYEDRIVPNILIGSAKEVIQNITLVESVSKLDEVVVLGDQEKGEILNEMAVVSARTFSVEETQRFAGSFDDPARMAAGFAGVNGNAEGNNDIIVRGNSSRGILWRLEGIAIPNPNHFAGEGTTGGPINALNSHMLANSDFFTGAFAPEYGDATSGVFDMKLKNGNNEQREYSASISTLGLDMSAEGPFKKGYNGSYLVNYRYSSLDLLDRAGVVDFGGVPRYQDLSFKIALPAGGKHNFSIFGLGGVSSIDEEDKDEEDENTIISKANVTNRLGIAGITHTYQLNDNIYIRSALAGTGTSFEFDEQIPTVDQVFNTTSIGKFTKSSLIGTTAFNYKLNAKHKIETGVIFTRNSFNMKSDDWNYDEDQLINELDEDGSSTMFQAYASWKYRATEKMTFISGLHYLHFALNDNYSVEPRVAMHWQFKERQAFTVGFGLHSKLDGVATYLAKQFNEDGTFSQPNKNLGIGKSAHFVVGYDNQIGERTHLKVETYYQHLFDVPVENSFSSAFSLLNETDGYTTRALVNDGKGKNYGVEFTLERYLHDGFYYMSTLSLFRSLYTAKDGIERKSAFDNNYVANLIGGKEFRMGNPNKNRVFFANTKIVLIGGKRFSPIDLEASRERGEEVRNDAEPFTAKSNDIFRLDLAIGIRRNRARTTTELKFDVQNILNNQVVVNEYYVPATQGIDKGRQLGLLPTISYKISF